MTVITPLPRRGLLGSWDRLVGPGMSRAENALVLSAGGVGSVAATLWAMDAEADWFAVLIAAILGLDVIGGAVCNATDTTKRWYHRPEAAPAHHFGFVVLHVAHVALVAWAFRGSAFDFSYFAVIGGAVVVCSLLVLASPLYLKRPVAAGLYLVALALAFYGVGPTPGVEWFVPALFLKLHIGHLVPERP